MYMSLLRLKDRRLLLTFTVRDLRPPLGVRAIPGVETEDGFEFDLAHDRVMLDTKTGSRYQGGGFGSTVQLDDGTLVTSYSYRGEDNDTHLEVVRWTLPAPSKAAGALPPTLHFLLGLELINQRRGVLERVPEQLGCDEAAQRSRVGLVG